MSAADIMGFGVYRSGTTLAAPLALLGRYPSRVLESLPVSSNGTPGVSSFAHSLLTYPFCAPLLVAFLLVFFMIIYPSESRDYDSRFGPCKRLHAIFTKAGLEPPLPPSPPAKWHPVFRVYITPAPPAFSRSKTGSVLGRHYRHRSNRYRLPGPDFEKVMEDIWESPKEEKEELAWSGAFDYFSHPTIGSSSYRRLANGTVAVT